MPEKTFILIKPNAMKNRHAGAIIKRLEKEGLQIVALKMLQVSKNLCERFYQEHTTKPFFKDLVQFITSRPVIVLALQGEDAIARVREIIGHTDPRQADPKSLRYKYGESISENAIHGSASPDSAKKELDLFFTSKELF